MQQEDGAEEREERRRRRSRRIKSENHSQRFGDNNEFDSFQIHDAGGAEQPANLRYISLMATDCLLMARANF